MAGILKETIREQRIHLQAGIVKQVDFTDTKPTLANIQNLSDSAIIYIGENSGVSITNFKTNIIAMGKKNYTNGTGFKQLYLYSQTDADVIVTSCQAEIYASDFEQTQQTIVVNNNVPVSVGINSPIPTGTNHIGTVTLDNANIQVTTQSEVEVKNDSGNPIPTNVMSALPTGDNNIGNVDIVSLPSIPTGSNTIGKIDVNDKLYIAHKITVVAGVTFNIGSNLMVASINTSLTDLIVSDDFGAIWKGNYNGCVPFNVATNLTLYSVTGGDVYIVYK